MRQTVFNDGTVTYPDEIAFAFNPFIIELENENKGDVTIDITNIGSGRKYSDARPYYGDKFSVDLSKYIQLLFDRPEYMGSGERLVDTSINVLIDVKEDSRIYTFNVVCVWGYIEVGETFNASRKVRWFNNFPQTLSLFIPTGTELQYRYNLGGYQKYEGEEVNAINHILIGLSFPTGTESGAFKVVGGDVSSVWDDTFDHTFAANPAYETIIEVKADDCEEGVFLRWVDRFGFYQYWLFQPSEYTYDGKSDGEKIVSIELVNVRHYEFGRYQGRENERTIRMGASMLDKEEAEMIVGVIQSPLVAMWSDGAWIPVNVSDGDVKLSSEHLQDVEITVELPELKTQRL
jgi:hypothetical protein